MVENSANSPSGQDGEQETPFTGYIRFKEEVTGFGLLRDIPGSFNILQSPVPDDKRLVCGISPGQYQILKRLLEENGVEHEMVEWPKDVKKPFVWPPGLSRLP